MIVEQNDNMPRMTVMTVEKQKKKKSIYIPTQIREREYRKSRKFTVIAVILDTCGSHVIRERIGFLGRCYPIPVKKPRGKARN